VFLAAGDILDFDFAMNFGGAIVGAAIGSVVRDRAVHFARERWERADLGVLAVNLAACAVVALVVAFGAAAPSAIHGSAIHGSAIHGSAIHGSAIHGLVVLGFAGGLSTWSSLAVDVAGMIRERRWKRVALHIPVAFACAVAIFLALSLLASDHSRGVNP
jgi:fluoride ion exporter CrcB/FEX